MLPFIKAAVGVAIIAIVWVAIDLAWRRVFGRNDPRLPGCGGCGSCTNRCQSEPRGEPRDQSVNGET